LRATMVHAAAAAAAASMSGTLGLTDASEKLMTDVWTKAKEAEEGEDLAHELNKVALGYTARPTSRREGKSPSIKAERDCQTRGEERMQGRARLISFSPRSPLHCSTLSMTSSMHLSALLSVAFQVLQILFSFFPPPTFSLPPPFQGRF